MWCLANRQCSDDANEWILCVYNRNLRPTLSNILYAISRQLQIFFVEKQNKHFFFLDKDHYGCHRIGSILCKQRPSKLMVIYFYCDWFRNVRSSLFIYSSYRWNVQIIFDQVVKTHRIHFFDHRRIDYYCTSAKRIECLWCSISISIILIQYVFTLVCHPSCHSKAFSHFK